MAQNFILNKSGLYIMAHFLNSIHYSLVFLLLYLLLYDAITTVQRHFKSTHTCGASNRRFTLTLHHCSYISLTYESRGSRSRSLFHSF